MIHHRTGWDMLDGMASPAPARGSRDVPIRRIFAATADEHGMPHVDLTRYDRSRPISHCRQDAMRAAHEAGHPHQAIADFLGVDRTTVTYGIKQSERRARQEERT